MKSAMRKRLIETCDRVRKSNNQFHELDRLICWRLFEDKSSADEFSDLGKLNDDFQESLEKLHYYFTKEDEGVLNKIFSKVDQLLRPLEVSYENMKNDPKDNFQRFSNTDLLKMRDIFNQNRRELQVEFEKLWKAYAKITGEDRCSIL